MSIESESNTQFAICIKNDDYPPSLYSWRVYRVLPDEKAARRSLMSVIDELGEDYLFSSSYFVPVELPQAAKTPLMELA